MISFIDWLVISLILVISLGLGLLFSRKASSGGTVSYFAANRKLPWWAIGLSNTATYQSGAGGFVMLILTFGLVGNWIWWASWIIWMPLVAIIWAPMWRRMNISTTAELITIRYGGKKAEWARKAYAAVSCFGFAVLLIGYITGFFVKTIAPIIQVSEIQVLLVLGGITVLYTVFGGLTGVVYVDVLQFFIMLAGSFIFMFLAFDQNGGLTEVIDNIRLVRPDALKTTPPSESFGWPLLLILVIQGLFFAGSPTAGEGSTAQRFMAAKSERAAMTGQLFNTFLALSLRTLPIIGIGLVCIMVFTKALPGGGFELGIDDPVHAWGQLMNQIKLPVGVRGLLVAIEVVAYVSTLSTLINWGSSFVVNDLLPKRAVKNSRQQLMAGRLTTLALFLLAGFVAVLFVDNMISWFVFINSAMVIFLLPLSWLRFFWWRFNVWGELAAIILGLPLSVVVWFVLDYQNKSMWQGLAILLGLSVLILMLITWFTKPEKQEVLSAFYKRCMPPGLWKPFKIHQEGKDSGFQKGNSLVLNSVLGVLCSLGLVLFTNALFTQIVSLMLGGIILTLTTGFYLVIRLSKK
jgi:solute:Na+ symporter, SSS family